MTLKEYLELINQADSIERFDEMQKAFELTMAEVADEYEKIKHIENQKEFALANTSKYKGLLFALRTKNKRIRELAKEYLLKNYD